MIVDETILRMSLTDAQVFPLGLWQKMELLYIKFICIYILIDASELLIPILTVNARVIKIHKGKISLGEA
jgi:hypothetical protein